MVQKPQFRNAKKEFKGFLFSRIGKFPDVNVQLSISLELVYVFLSIIDSLVVAVEKMDDMHDEFFMVSDEENVVKNVNIVENEMLGGDSVIVPKIGMIFKDEKKCLRCARDMIMMSFFLLGKEIRKRVKMEFFGT